MTFNLEAAFLLEGLSDKAKQFKRIVTKIVTTPPPELLKIVLAQAEGILPIVASITEGTSPKGELAEVARGQTHRVCAIRFPTTDRKEFMIYVVVPLKDMSGEEIKDTAIASAVAARLKAADRDMKAGVPESQLELDTLFKLRGPALEKLHSIDSDIKAAGENPAKTVMRDPIRGVVSKLLAQYYPAAAQKYVAALAALDRGTFERAFSAFSWNTSNIPTFTQMAAAAAADKDLDDPATIKSIAGLAVAYIATQVITEVAA